MFGYVKRRFQSLMLVTLAILLQLLLAVAAKAETPCSYSVPIVISKSSAAPKAVAVTIHGFGLHKRSYDAFAREMTDRNITTYALDVRGFGDWQVNCPYRALNFERALNDIGNTINSIKKHYPGVPVYLVGESMGGALVLAYASEHEGQIEGVIASVPAYTRSSAFPTTISVATRYLLGAGGPINMNRALVGKASSSSLVRNNWRHDKNARLRFSLSELIRFNRFMKRANHMATTISSTPVLLLQGERDRLIKPVGTTSLFAHMPTQDKELALFDTEEHLILEERQVNKKVVAKIDSWITLHQNSNLLASLK